MGKMLRYVLFLLPLIAIMAMGAKCGAGGAASTEVDKEPESVAPPPLPKAKQFLGEDISGNEFSLSSLEGRNFILFFFSAIEHKELREASLSYASYIEEVMRRLDQEAEPFDFVVVGVQYYHPDTHVEDARSFRNQIDLKLDHLIIDDEDSTAFTAFKAGIPEVVMCNAGFRQVAKISGAGDEKLVDQLVTQWKERYRRGMSGGEDKPEETPEDEPAEEATDEPAE